MSDFGPIIKHFDYLIERLNKNKDIIEKWLDSKPENVGLMTEEEYKIYTENNESIRKVILKDGKINVDVDNNQLTSIFPYFVVNIELTSIAIDRIPKTKKEEEMKEETPIIEDKNLGRKKITDDSIADLKILLEKNLDVMDFIRSV